MRIIQDSVRRSRNMGPTLCHRGVYAFRWPMGDTLPWCYLHARLDHKRIR